MRYIFKPSADIIGSSSPQLDCRYLWQEAVEAHERIRTKLRALKKATRRVRKQLTDFEATVASLPRDPHGAWGERDDGRWRPAD